jgi:hypothetical protein
MLASGRREKSDFRRKKDLLCFAGILSAREESRQSGHIKIFEYLVIYNGHIQMI